MTMRRALLVLDLGQFRARDQHGRRDDQDGQQQIVDLPGCYRETWAVLDVPRRRLTHSSG